MMMMITSNPLTFDSVSGCSGMKWGTWAGRHGGSAYLLGMLLLLLLKIVLFVLIPRLSFLSSRISLSRLAFSSPCLWWWRRWGSMITGERA